jgi:DUF4097 and DUF4098 domain-containing protein YvlB
MKTLYAVLCLSGVALAQQVSGDRIAVPFSDASRPRVVKGQLLQGCFVVEGYDGNEVVVEPRGSSGRSSKRRPPRGAEGLTRLDIDGLDLTVEEQNNTVTIRSHSGNGGDIAVRVPRSTSLKLECTNGGDMKVDNVTGDLELNNLNGDILASGISGSVVAHSLNGKVTIGFDRVTPEKAMSFSSLNGNIDVTLPPDARGTLRVKSDNGETYTDFEVKLVANAAPPTVEDNRGRGGKYKVKMDRTMIGTINGGGPDMSLKTLNGNIYIRKKK